MRTTRMSSLPNQIILGCQAFCMPFCTYPFSPQIFGEYTNVYLIIKEFYLEMPKNNTYSFSSVVTNIDALSIFQKNLIEIKMA